MKFHRITHYVAHSFEHEPSFIIDLKDDADEIHSFISNGCQFVPFTEEAMLGLRREFECGRELDKLLDSPIQSHDVVTDLSWAFDGAGGLLTEFVGDFPNCNEMAGVFFNCHLLETLHITVGALLHRRFPRMFEGCHSLNDRVGAATALKRDRELKIGEVGAAKKRRQVAPLVVNI
ncbi:hypothetical protein NVP1081O_226 [Vibrio phage 1.081.O._10N.286.52.C2]|nr:hypothetical protein NVP1081O_226 [Vibrio phage 1.081.O._10N.286.52.C2]